MNQGAWNYVRPRLQSVINYAGYSHRANVGYIGRDPSSASATGHHDAHEKELESFLKISFS